MLQLLVEQHSTLFLCLAFFFGGGVSHINQFMQYLSLYVWLISLSKMSSRLIHLVTLSQKVLFYSFLRLNNISLYPIHILLIYLSVDIQLGFSMSLLLYNAAMNMSEDIALCSCFQLVIL